MGKVIEDWRDICFVDSVLEHIGNPHPSVIAVSVGIVKRYIEREAILTEKSFARVDDCGNRSWSDSDAVDTAKRVGMSLRRSLCLSDAYWNVPVEVQLHVTVLLNYLYHLPAMLRRAKEKAVVS
jgi:hypothetical protein